MMRLDLWAASSLAVLLWPCWTDAAEPPALPPAKPPAAVESGESPAPAQPTAVDGGEAPAVAEATAKPEQASATFDSAMIRNSCFVATKRP